MIQTIDVLLQKNPYFKGKSIADRLAIYNIALKQLAELRSYFYTNQTSTTNFTINQSSILSSMDSIDDILLDDLSTLTQQERLLIYNMVQSRIGSLRNLQNHHYYLVTNTHGQLTRITRREFPLLKLVRELIYTLISGTKELPIQQSVRIIVYEIKQKIMEFPLLHGIVNFDSTIGGIQQKIKTLEFPLLKTILTLSIVQNNFVTKVLEFPLLKSILNVVANSTETTTLEFPLLKSVVNIFAGVTNQIKTLEFPIIHTTVVIESYQYIKESHREFPIIHSINTI